VAEAERQEAAEDHQALLATVRAGEEDERRVQAEREAQRQETAQVVKQQLKEFIGRRVDEARAAVAEGKRLAEDAKQRALEAEEAKRKRREAVVLENKKAQLANLELQRERDALRAQAAAEDEQRRLYSEKQAAQMVAREEYIKGKEAEAARKAKLISERLEREYLAYMQRDQARTEQAAQEAEQKASRLEAERAELQRRTHREIAANRLEVAAQREHDRQQQLLNEQRQLQQLRQNVALLEEREAQRAMERKAKAKAVQLFHLAQMADKKRAIEQAMQGERSGAAEAAALSAGVGNSLSNVLFHTTAEELVSAEQSKGHTTLLMRRNIARSLKDPLFASDSTF
jgi:hypothetical protein